MRVLLIKDGSALLGKLPVVPGLERQLLAPVPNDDQRLAAEGFINGLQEELLDLVAHEKILAVMIQTRIEKKRFDEATDLDRPTAASAHGAAISHATGPPSRSGWPPTTLACRRRSTNSWAIRGSWSISGSIRRRSTTAVRN